VRIFGHPLHPMVVHFPIALWTLGTCFDLAVLAGWPQFWQPAGQLILIGLAIGVLSGIAGAIDFVAMSDDEAAQDTAMKHMMLMGTAWSIYLFAYLLRLEAGSMAPEPSLMPALLSLAGFLTMAAGAHYGGALIYTHGVGVVLKKNTSRKG